MATTNTDWTEIKRKYRDTTLSVSAIAREHGVSHTAIGKRAKKHGWERVAEPEPIEPAETSPETKTGRPTEYQDIYAEQATKLYALGATDLEVADFFEVSGQTLYNWLHQHPAFLEAAKAGKEACDDRVERSLYHRAVGYTHDAVKVFQHKGQPVLVPYREHVPPDVSAATLWLKNRRKDIWRDKQEHQHTGANGGPIETKEVTNEMRARVLAAFFAKVKCSSSEAGAPAQQAT